MMSRPLLLSCFAISFLCFITGCGRPGSTDVAGWWYNAQPDDFHTVDGAVGGRGRSATSSMNASMRGRR